MDITRRLDTLCDRYGLCKTEGEFQKGINRVVGETVKRLIKGRKVGIRGAGEHTQKLLELLSDKSSIVGIYDNFARCGELGGIKTYPVRDLFVHDIDTVLLSSFAFRQEMAAELAGQEKKFMVLDIYEELAKQNCRLGEAFYLRSRYTYLDIIYLQNQYREAAKAAQRGSLLKRIIAAYIHNKDFHSGFQCIEEYIKNRYEDYETIKNLKQELETLLRDIRDSLRKRSRHGKKDIIMHLCDAVRYDSLRNMPYLNESFREGIFFENAYTVTPYTNPTVAAMFYKLHVIEDYGDINNNWTENPVQTLARSRGYHTFVIEGEDCYDDIQIDILGNKYCKNPLSQCFWMLYQKLLESEEPVFVILYSAVETHMPWLSPNQREPEISPRYFQHALKSEGIQEQQRQALLYIDAQYCFFERIADYDYSHIFISDHGTWQDIDERRWEDKALHTVLAIRGADIPAVREERMFSLLNFYELIDWMTDRKEEKYENIFAEDISFQDIEFFSRAYVESFVKMGKQSLGMAFRGARGREDKFVRVRDGREYYFRLPDESSNYINNPDYQDRIAQLRQKAGDYFLDIYTHGSFKFARQLYETI